MILLLKNPVKSLHILKIISDFGLFIHFLISTKHFITEFSCLARRSYLSLIIHSFLKIKSISVNATLSLHRKESMQKSELSILSKWFDLSSEANPSIFIRNILTCYVCFPMCFACFQMELGRLKGVPNLSHRETVQEQNRVGLGASGLVVINKSLPKVSLCPSAFIGLPSKIWITHTNNINLKFSFQNKRISWYDR
jgi:hypothetical protein